MMTASFFIFLVFPIIMWCVASALLQETKSEEAVCLVPAALAELKLPGITPMSYQNWDGQINAVVWTYAPRRVDEIPQLANWAALNGWRIRAVGRLHSWSPITVTNGTDCTRNYLILKTVEYLNNIRINPPRVVGVKQEGKQLYTVTAQAGVLLDNLLAVLQQSGLGLTSFPTIGSITLGGALAVNAHGTGVPLSWEKSELGHGYGSLSNLVVDLTACVYSAESRRYVLRKYERSERGIRPFLTHLGRAVVVEATLQVGTNQRLRCQSYTDIPASTLFAHPTSPEALAPNAQTFERMLSVGGRLDILWFPFTKSPWIKSWTLSPIKPRFSREVAGPYNYVFSQNFPKVVSDVLQRIMKGDGTLTPVFSNIQMGVVAAGLVTAVAYDIWGWSRDLFIYLKQSSIRFQTNGYAILCSRANVQQVVYDIASAYTTLLDSYASRGEYPVNYAMEFRTSSLDYPHDVAVASSGPPLVSSVRPDPLHPERDTAIWINLSTMPNTPYSADFYTDFETFLYLQFDGSAVRPEWSKGWAYSSKGAWISGRVITDAIPRTFREGYAVGDGWDAFVAGMQSSDPYQVFTNEFLQVLLQG